MHSEFAQILLLAAGTGSRFDSSGARHKLLMPLANSADAVLARTLRNAQTARQELDAPSVLAVVRPPAASNPHAALIEQVITDAGCNALSCADAHLGMGASLSAGVAATAAARGWLVLLADMPYVQPSTLVQLLQTLAQRVKVGDLHAIVAPTFNGQRGQPVAIGPAHYDALLALRADQGARSILEQYPVTLVSGTDRGILQDIDVPADLG